MTDTFTFTYPCPANPNKETIKVIHHISDIEMDGIELEDYPDFCNAFISSALVNGRKATEAELDQMQDNSDLVYENIEYAIY
jgi:hypothetical protein